jgi:sporulation-control protein spo0M
MIRVPASIAPRYKELAVRGEKVKKVVRTSATWVLLTDQALYCGEPLQRYRRADITGIEFDRAGAEPGTMFFMSGSEPLARIDFAGSDRALLGQVEQAFLPRKKVVRLLVEQDDFAPGEMVHGIVEVDWPKTAPVRGIRVGLVGTEETEISVSYQKSSTTFSEMDPQISEEWILFGGDRIGWGRAAGEALRAIFRKTNHPELAAGRHRFPFEIKLPADALPSYEGTHSKVKYRLYAVIDVPLGFDRIFEGILAVVEPREAKVVPVSYVSDQPAKGLMKSITADLRMGFQIRQVPYHYGENLNVRLRVENRSGKRIRAARIALSAVEDARADDYNRRIRTDLRNFALKFPDPAAESQDYAFDIAIPAWPVPFVGRYSRVDLWLSATLDIAWALNATIDVPLQIE